MHLSLNLREGVEKIELMVNKYFSMILFDPDDLYLRESFALVMILYLIFLCIICLMQQMREISVVLIFESPLRSRSPNDPIKLWSLNAL